LIKILKAHKIAVDVCSGVRIIQDEASNTQLKLKMTYEDLIVEKVIKEYDGVICVSGALKPTLALWKNQVLRKIIIGMDAKGKVCAGICVSAPTVAIVMENRKMTCFPLIDAKAWVRNHGAILTNRTVEVDKNVVTALDQHCTQLWAEIIARKIVGLPTEDLEIKTEKSGF